MKTIRIFLILLFVTSAQADVFRFAVIGDGGEWNSMSRKVRDSIVRSGIRDLVLPGDNTYSEFLGRRGYENAWSPWYSLGFRTSVVAIGNHNSSYSTETAFFNMPGEYYAKTFSDRQGVPKVRFIVLNSDNENTVAQQSRFLTEQLQSAVEPFVFIVYHHPTYNTGGQHNWTQKEAFQRAVRPLLQRFAAKISAVLVGHDHIASAYRWGSVKAYCSGAVHETRRASHNNETASDGVVVETLYMFPSRAKSGYWLRLEADSDSGELQSTFVRANDDADVYRAID